MILVAGATGFLGGEICRRLAARGEPVRGLVRVTSDPAALERLHASGVETVVGDLRDRGSLDAACRGARTVVSTVTTMRSRQPGDSIEATDEAGQLALVDAAREAGVGHFVFVSLSGNIHEGPLAHAKRAVERRLRESGERGMTCTILRPTCFMDVWLGPALGFDPANRRATLYGSGEGRISFIALGDVAEFATRAASATREPAAVGATIELGGPQALSPLEAVRIFEEVANAPFEVQHVPVEALQARSAAATDSLEQSFAALVLHYARGDEIPMEQTLRRMPVPLTSVREYARTVLGA